MMEKRFQFQFIVLLVSSGLVHSDSDFTYFGNLGPAHWGEHYNQCAGKHQSPIDINEIDVTEMEFSLMTYNEIMKKPTNVTLTNNGHTVLVKLTYDAPLPYIRYGPLKGEYEFQQLHFHWGENSTVGSEDRINNVAYPMELHMVFRNKKYASFEEAVRRDHGVVVLAFFYEISNKFNEDYDLFTRDLGNIVEPNTSTQGYVNYLFSIMSDNLQEYYTYTGSLTTPPCSEDVTWIDYIHPIAITEECMERFRALKTFNGSPLSHNFRPVQPLNNRKVYRAKDSQFIQEDESDIPFIDAWNDDKDGGRNGGMGSGANSYTNSPSPLSLLRAVSLMAALFIISIYTH